MRSVAAFCLVNFGAACAHGFGGGKPVPLQQPPAESCLLGNAGCICFDSRLSEPPKGTTPISCAAAGAAAEYRQQVQGGVCYIRKYGLTENSGGCLNFPATNPGDDNAQQEWVLKNCFGPERQR